MKRTLLFVILIILNFSFLFSEDWTLAATKFEINESILTTEAEKSGLEVISEQLPSLILDYLPQNITRTVFPEEMFQRDRYKILRERQSLYSSLSSQIKSRDALVFNHTDLELKRKIENSERTIENTVKKINESKNEELLLIKNFESNKKEKNKITDVVLYQNDSTKLFNVDDSKSIDKINSASVHGLITGKIFPYGNYVKVESTLTLYPEEKVLATVTEVGLVSEVEYIASSINNQFLSFIINDELVNTDILIYPPDAGENATVYIQDYVLHGKTVSTKFIPGEHSIRIESPGYETVYFSHNYVPKQDKIISINMKKINQVNSYFFIEDKKKNSQFDLSSQIFLNSELIGNNPISVMISDKTYLGEVVSNSDKDIFSFFVLKNGFTSESIMREGQSEDEVALQINLPEAKHNLSKRIDKSRKRMYWSYGGLILTLPIYYFSKGTYELCVENSSIVNPSSINTWKKASDISLYTVIGAGVNFAVQFVLYLIDANKVVPKTVEPKIVNQNEIESLNSQIVETRKAEEDAKTRELELKKLEEEKKLQEEMNNENSSLDEKTETNNLNTDELDEILDSSENIDFQELNQDKEG